MLVLLVIMYIFDLGTVELIDGVNIIETKLDNITMEIYKNMANRYRENIDNEHNK